MFSRVMMSLNFPGMLFRLTLWLALIAVLLCAPVVLGEDVGMNGKSAYSKRVEQLIHECYLRYPEPPWITLGEFLRRRKQEEWLIVDVRSRRERKVSIIPGALSIDELKRRIGDYKGENILVYCTVGCRSGAYAQRLRKRGIQAFNLRGGVLVWAMDGRAFVTDDGKVTHRVHVYARKWNVLPPGYEAVW